MRSDEHCDIACAGPKWASRHLSTVRFRKLQMIGNRPKARRAVRSRHCCENAKADKMAGRHSRANGVVGTLPWPADKRWSWEKSAVRHRCPQKSAGSGGPLWDTVDTRSWSRRRTFYYVKRQLGDAKPRPWTQTPFRPKQKRAARCSLRVARATCSAALGHARPRSARLRARPAPFGSLRDRID